jgi:phage terminase small subunit
VRRSVEDYPTYPIWRCVLAQLTAELGYEAEARAALAAVAADRCAALPFDEEWLVSMGLLAETAAALGDRERAAILYDLLHPYADRVAISYPDVSTGSVARYLGLLAATMDRHDEAERHFEDAMQTNARIGAPSWLAHTKRDYARMLRARAAPDDEETARALMSQADATHAELGIRPPDRPPG